MTNHRENYEAFYDIAYGLRAIVAVIDGLGRIHESIPAAGGSGDWSEERYVDAQRDILQDAREWLTVFHDLKSLREGDITPRTLAFMRALGDLATAELLEPDDETPLGPPPLTATLTLNFRPPNGSAQTVSFGGGAG